MQLYIKPALKVPTADKPAVSTAALHLVLTHYQTVLFYFVTSLLIFLRNFTFADPVSVLTRKTRPVLITTLTSQCAVCRLYIKIMGPELFFNFSTHGVLNVNNAGTKQVRFMTQREF